ncbi:MAG: preprotein translocase subunit SecE [Peptococcaceae bacterium]|nr:preprotein translocase subunit SecE [Peptococcaceae bacterium]MBT9135122.1 Protein translocase subunit SecE [Bacillota bacterium]MBT9152005.1 Protein translocase subunit SecE [Bacillota bacterium]MBT9157738.1 Protein translocase subunit SecE [Bacillota bacterium]
MKFVQFLREKYLQLSKFLREVRQEMRKVAWPSKRQTINYTIVVVFAVFFVAALTALTDAAFGVIIRRLLGI